MWIIAEGIEIRRAASLDSVACDESPFQVAKRGCTVRQRIFSDSFNKTWTRALGDKQDCNSLIVYRLSIIYFGMRALNPTVSPFISWLSTQRPRI